ncbi:site-2 protease family protein [Candidatus Peregrinibacteria bacterium]|jgi:Zn-dependent protease|nr:site-2 protease family protein [Candidatus Peregrinibacteria bacterium]MBT7737037.1 site-2 protease family protein [Candidatus Peregrinibacteria bacterium]
MFDVIEFLYFLVALVIALTVHEASHALVAYYLGDPTAKLKGRLTLNPLKHLDVYGSLIFLLTQRIGWGKPVPVNPGNFKSPVRDSALTALAGPASNFILAFAVVLPWKYVGVYMPDAFLKIFQYVFHVSIFLGVFNLFPFPPLDGSKILGLFIPRRWHAIYAKYLTFGVRYFVVIILVDVFILRDFFGFSFFYYAVSFLHEWISAILFLGT